MSITGKLFGSIGEVTADDSARVSVTARPGYGAWYARQMARSYAQRRNRQFCELPLAA